MNSSRNPTSAIENNNPDTFRRRLLCNWQCVWPRRYVLALMLCLLLVMCSWWEINIFDSIFDVIFEEKAYEKYPSIGNWTLEELINFDKVNLVIEIFTQIPGALLIFMFSSHKYILIVSIINSFLHMLTPTALRHHSASLLFLLITHGILVAPIRIAIISIWSNWAAPAERTKLITLSIMGMFLGSAITKYLSELYRYISFQSYYFSGVIGLIWALFFYNITSDSPQNDPLISENELLYLENNIPSGVQEIATLKAIPWKSMLTSKQIIAICAVFFKMGVSVQGIKLCTFSFEMLLRKHEPMTYLTTFFVALLIIIPCSAIIADCLIKRCSGRTLFIRKSYLCGGFFLQCCFMCGTLVDSEVPKTVFFMLSYICFVASLPGFITVAMDLSPRFVAIILGFALASYVSGIAFVHLVLRNAVDVFAVHSLIWIFLCDGIVTLISAAIFFKWGDVEEQLWSLSASTTPRSNGNKSYPHPDDQGDANLVPENA